MHLGDKNSVICEMSGNGSVVDNHMVENTNKSLRIFFSKRRGATVALTLKAGSHSPRISRLLSSLGCEVLAGNPRKLRVILDSNDKTDHRDAEMLARIARFDPELLYPVIYLGLQAQVDLKLLQSRDVLVKNRSRLINHVRNSVKSLGGRLPGSSAASFTGRRKSICRKVCTKLSCQ